MNFLSLAAFVLLLLCPSGALAAGKHPLKVFILAGQSNMQGHANVATLGSMAEDPKTAPLLKEILDSQGAPRRFKDIWISSIGCAGNGYSDVIEETGTLTTGWGASHEEIGPELTFGITMEKSLKEPILIIKTSWGGRSLLTDFRPPSAGKRIINDFTLSRWKERGLDAAAETAKIDSACGVFYGHMIDHIRRVLGDIKRVMPDYDPKQGFELAGFVWFQGFNDMIDDWSYRDRMQPGGYAEYADLEAKLIRDVRTDLNAPRLPFVIGVMGIGGMGEDEKSPMSNFRKAQAVPASLPEFKGTVSAVRTAPFWDDHLDQLQQRREKFNDQWNRAHPKGDDLARKQALSDQFSPTEQHDLEGVSNGGYHYLGAAKILAPIGKAFAESLLGLMRHKAR